MEKVEAVLLKIEPLARRVGRQQNSHRVYSGVGVEGLFDFLEFLSSFRIRWTYARLII